MLNTRFPGSWAANLLVVSDSVSIMGLLMNLSGLSGIKALNNSPFSNLKAGICKWEGSGWNDFFMKITPQRNVWSGSPVSPDFNP